MHGQKVLAGMQTAHISEGSLLVAHHASHVGSIYQHVCVVLWPVCHHAVLGQLHVGLIGPNVGCHSILPPASPGSQDQWLQWTTLCRPAFRELLAPPTNVGQASLLWC